MTADTDVLFAHEFGSPVDKRFVANFNRRSGRVQIKADPRMQQYMIAYDEIRIF
ncbi:hypothetical protein [Paenibacillus oleatilyticus]|uniref:Uncharacterized protein n=1 Tax=Paenibacillus oleatilyticus TaxID=2594886 RepID=A0ABV4V750_9BACL